MSPARSWSDLHSELLMSIANVVSVSLRDYVCLRGVCTAWRSALEPPSYPCLLSLADDNGRYSASVFSLPMRRPFHLQTVYSTLEGDHDRERLVSAVRACASLLPLPMLGHFQAASSIVECRRDRDRRTRGSEVRSRPRVVGSSNGRFAVAVDDSTTTFRSCWTRRIFLLDPRAGKEVELAAPTTTLNGELPAPCHEYVRKVVFPPGPDDGTVVALYGKQVACIDAATSREKWMTIDVVASNTKHLVDLAFGDDGKLYCLDSDGGVHVVLIPRGGRNESAVVEPSSDLLYLNPAAAFTRPPCDIASALMNTKHIFFCHDSLYQVWQNNSATVNSGGFRMSMDEILVLRYDPGRWPRWDAVKDLGGCSVFIDKNSSPAVVRAAGVPGVRADCVYWINWMRVPMVCDIATGTSKPYALPYGPCRGNCWYFGHDDMTCINDGERKGRN